MEFTSDGDSVEGLMTESIDHGYRYPDAADLRVIAPYLQGITPVRHRVSKKQARSLHRFPGPGSRV